MLVYLLLNWAFPVPGAARTFEEVDVSGWEDSRSSHDEKSDRDSEVENQDPFKSA